MKLLETITPEAISALPSGDGQALGYNPTTGTLVRVPSAAAAVAGLVPRIKKVALIGDSLTENCQVLVGMKTSSWWHTCNALLSLPFVLSWKSATEATFAKAGKTSADLIAGGYPQAAAASDADAVVIMSGTNGLSIATPAAIAAQNVAMWDMQLAAGKSVIALPILPRNTLAAEAAEVNARMTDAAALRPRVVWCPSCADVLFSATGALDDAYRKVGDDVHLNELGDYVLGAELARLLTPLTLTTQRALGVVCNSNRFMLGNNAGLANGFDASVIGNGTCTPSKASDSAGPGRFYQVLTVASTTPWVYKTAISSGFTIGQRVALSAKVGAVMSAPVQIGIQVRFWIGTGWSTSVSASDVNSNITTPKIVSCDPVVIPAGTTDIVLEIIAAGTGVVSFGDFVAVYLP